MNQNSHIGILGGGQLSMMLLQKAQALGLQPQHLTPSKEDPACRVSNSFLIGDPRAPQDLQKFTHKLDLLTFESEFYEAAYLKKQLSNFEGFIFPSLQVLDILQDRKTQKLAVMESKIATSPFIQTSETKKVQDFFTKTGPLVAKKRWNGYDGYGTFVLKTKNDLDQFIKNETQNLDQFIFEKFIPFEYEMAVQVARSRKGHVVFFPFVKTTQKDNKCFLVEGPEKKSAQILKAQQSIKKFLNKIDYVGVIGFEFFKTSKGLILNEVAPRVHNTGHHTLDSCTVDQFTMHWLCALQDELPAVELKTKSFVMLNLIGTGEHEIKPPDRLNGSLYWYGKKNRKGRKLGHINFVGEKKKALVHKASQELKRWKL